MASIDQHRVRKAELTNAGGNLSHLRFAMGTGITSIRNQRFGRAVLNVQWSHSAYQRKTRQMHKAQGGLRRSVRSVGSFGFLHCPHFCPEDSSNSTVKREKCCRLKKRGSS